MTLIAKCISDGEEMTFDFFGENVLLEKIDGISKVSFDVKTVKGNTDGEIYQDSTANKRNLVITLEILKDYKTESAKLFSFFQIRKKGTFIYENKKIDYYVESVDIASEGFPKTAVISLICPDPKFHDAEDTITEMAATKSLLVFPFTYNPPFKVSEKVATLIANIRNNSSIPMGLLIEFTASGSVSNPSLTDVYKQTCIKVITDMVSGDIIRISTVKGHKSVVLIKNGVEENINNKLYDYSDWLQAYLGDNLFRYNADSGIDNLAVKITTDQCYWGV